MYPRNAFTRCAPPLGLRHGTEVARRRLRPIPRLRPGPSEAHLRRPTALRRLLVTYADRTLTCVDCGSDFIHSADDQQYYAEKGFAAEPKRCVSCRASRRAARDGGSSYT